MTQTTKHTSTQTPFHFYAANVGMWATTTADRDLPALIKLMEKDGLTFNLFYVPLPDDAPYKIKFYKPDVEGAVYLGTFEPKTKTKTKTKTKAA